MLLQVRLWVHETYRVFGDRLVSGKDRSVVISYLKDLTRTVFSYDFETLFGHLDANHDGIVDDVEFAQLIFAPIDTSHSGEGVGAVTDDVGASPFVYDEVGEPDGVASRDLKSVLTDMHAEYNLVSSKPMSLALSQYAIEHLIRVLRVLHTPGGHALLVGVGGSGREALTRLAAFISGIQVAQLCMVQSYSLADWRADLKKLCWSAGAEGTRTVLLFSDSQAKLPQFLEDLNSLLNCGEVPALFGKQERADAAEKIRDSVVLDHRRAANAAALGSKSADGAAGDAAGGVFALRVPC